MPDHSRAQPRPTQDQFCSLLGAAVEALVALIGEPFLGLRDAPLESVLHALAADHLLPSGG